MINSETKLIGLIGDPISHSKSPIMHNTMLDKLGLNYRYLAFNVSHRRLEQAIDGIRALNIKGINVTIPHKVNVMKYLDDISEEAKRIGAVNTIVNRDGRLIGYNTDGEGYVRSLVEETGIKLEGKRVMLLGAGGAAKAIAYTLSMRNLDSIVIVNRNLDKAAELKDVIGKNASTVSVGIDEINDYINDAEIIINTTSIGLYPDIEESLIDKELIKPSHLVSDIIYNPLITKLLIDADNKGAMVHTGLGMFIYQGAIAFEKWTGVYPDTKFMRDTVIDSYNF
ncbi:MAG: shikimate dehydrogenase [Vulcanibacillus sp.]